MDDSDTRAPVRNAKGQFVMGSVGNPHGRPRGCRNKLGELFLQALHQDFAEHGAEAIAECRVTNPTAYVRVVATLLPRDALLEAGDDFAALSDEELRALVLKSIEELAADCAADESDDEEDC